MKTTISLVLVLLLFKSNAIAQQSSLVEKWEPLIGEWRGEGSGEPGKGSGVFSFKADLDNHILVRKSHSEYPAANGRPATIHDDLMVIYLEAANAPSKAIYFDN